MGKKRNHEVRHTLHIKVEGTAVPFYGTGQSLIEGTTVPFCGTGQSLYMHFVHFAFCAFAICAKVQFRTGIKRRALADTRAIGHAS